jgi:hypothetical protein
MTIAPKAQSATTASSDSLVAARLSDVLGAIEQQPVPDRLTRTALKLQAALDSRQKADHPLQTVADDDD